LVGCAEAFWGDGEIEVGVMSLDLESQWIGLRLRMIRMLRANRSTGNHGFSSQIVLPQQNGWFLWPCVLVRYTPEIRNGLTMAILFTSSINQ
jgi:hypothetical protein